MYCQKRKMPEFFFLITMGMFVKETIVLVVPCYYLLNMELPAEMRKKMFVKLSLLAGWCLAMFLACRIPFGFAFSNKTLNGVAELMILKNLRFSRWVVDWTTVLILYMHPILFIFMWIGVLIFYRKFISRPLFYTTLYLAAAIYLTNLCFGWNYESRNFIPAFCMIIVSTIFVFNRIKQRKSDYGRLNA
jgi:hypothetical protein